MRKVLSTKMLSDEVLQFAASLGFKVVCKPTIHLECVSHSTENLFKSPFDAVVFTSSKAVDCFLNNEQANVFIKDRRVFSTEGKTATVLGKLGIAIHKKGINAEDIARKIIDDGDIREVLHPCGNLALPVLSQKLGEADIHYHSLVVYRNERIPIPAQKAKFDAVLFFSPSGIDSFAQNNPLSEKTVYCCIGPTTGNYLRNLFQDLSIVVSEKTSPTAMFKALKQSLNQPNE
nr:uroporphyrinogen-III synthase [Saprospiraceae bacterium]